MLEARNIKERQALDQLDKKVQVGKQELKKNENLFHAQRTKHDEEKSEKKRDFLTLFVKHDKAKEMLNTNDLSGKFNNWLTENKDQINTEVSKLMDGP